MSSGNPELVLKEGPIGEQTLSFLTKSRSAPNTPRTAEELESPQFIPPQILINGEDGLSKEMQINMLKERLDFTEKQLIEKDRQLEHYKQLVKTLKDVLAELSGRRYTPANPARPPPGFENHTVPAPQPQKFQIKGRKVRSFHNEYYQPEDDDEEDSFENSKKSEKSAPAWRKPLEEPSPPEIIPHVPGRKETSSSSPPRETVRDLNNKAQTNQGYRITKSVSHTALSTLTDDDNQTPPPTREALRSSAPTVQKQQVSIEQVVGPTNVSKKPGALLKKSQSMTSVYSVLEENRLDSKFPDLEQMVGQIYALSKYQQGCRFLQKKA